MYIGKEEKPKYDVSRFGRDAHSQKKEFLRADDEEKEEIREKSSVRQEEREIVNPTSVIYKWRAVEHEIYEKDRKWYTLVGLILAAIVIYALFTDGLVMAITFILIGAVGYVILNKNPREINFYITDDGVIADREIYEFEEIKSFWIFYEAEGIKVISLHVKSKFMPYVHIPLGQENPTELREILLKYIEEIKQKPSAVDTFERLLGV